MLHSFIFHAVTLGSIQELTAETCSEIKASEGSEMVTKEYWIYSDGNSVKPSWLDAKVMDFVTGSSRNFGSNYPKIIVKKNRKSNRIGLNSNFHVEVRTRACHCIKKPYVIMAWLKSNCHFIDEANDSWNDSQFCFS